MHSTGLADWLDGPNASHKQTLIHIIQSERLVGDNGDLFDYSLATEHTQKLTTTRRHRCQFSFPSKTLLFFHFFSNRKKRLETHKLAAIKRAYLCQTVCTVHHLIKLFIFNYFQKWPRWLCVLRALRRSSTTTKNPKTNKMLCKYKFSALRT